MNRAGIRNGCEGGYMKNIISRSIKNATPLHIFLWGVLVGWLIRGSIHLIVTTWMGG